MVIPTDSLKREGAEVGERMGERRLEEGELGCVMVVVTRIALHHLYWLDPPGNYKVVCFQLFPSEVSRHVDQVECTHWGT